MIHEDMDVIAKALVAAGVRAVTDPRRVDPPCVLVVPESAQFDSMCEGQANTEWVLHLLAPPPGAADTFRQLSALAAKVIAAVPRIETVRMASYQTDNGSTWPSFDMRFTTESSWT